MKINEAKQELHKSRSLVYNLILFDIMYVLFQFTKEKCLILKEMCTIIPEARNFLNTCSHVLFLLKCHIRYPYNVPFEILAIVP